MKKSKKMIGMLLLICAAMILPVSVNAASKSQTKEIAELQRNGQIR